MPLLLADALTRYSRDARARGFSESTIRNTLRCVTRFIKYVGQDDLNLITAEDLKNFIVSLRGKKVYGGDKREQEKELSPTSINTYFRTTRAFWGYLAAEKLITASPMADVPAPKFPRPVPKSLSQEEIDLIYEAASGDPFEKAMICLFIDTGVRLAGLVALSTGDVDLDKGTISVKGKGGRDYKAFIIELTKQAIREYLMTRAKSSYIGKKLFVSEAGHPISASVVQKRLEKLGKFAGLSRRLSAHLLRRSYASLSTSYDMNLDYLSRTMGHADVETTARNYISAADEAIARAHAEASPLAHMKGMGETKLCGPLETHSHFTEPNLKENLTSQTTLANAVNELRAYSISDGEIKLDAAEMLKNTWLELTDGKTDYEYSDTLHKKLNFPNDTKLLPLAQEILGQLRLRRVVEVVEKRVSTGPRSYDVSLWRLTDFGADLVRNIDQQPKN